MHFDLAHAIVTGLLVFATMMVLQKTGIIEKSEHRKFSWKAVVAITVVVFVLNLLWPSGP